MKAAPLIEVPMTVIFSKESRPLSESSPGFDQAAFVKKTVAKDNEKKPFFKITDLNLVPYRIPAEGVPHVNPTDNSQIELEVVPEKVGTFHLHIVIGQGTGAVEISGSPFKVEIAKSEVHKQLQEERQRLLDEKAEKARLEAEKQKLLKQ